jgi:hypothetical protein
VVVTDKGLTVLVPMPMYDWLAAQGEWNDVGRLHTPPLQAPVEGEDTRQWSKPATLEFWADVFDKSERAMRTWLKEGVNVRGRKRGQRWSILWIDLPRSWREKHPECRE